MAPKKAQKGIASTAGTTSTSTSTISPGKRNATGLILICILSIGVGIFVHARSLHFPRYNNIGWLKTATSLRIRDELKLGKSWPGTTIFDDYGGEFWRFLLVLVAFFQDAIGNHVGQSILILITSVLGPVVSYMTIESLKDGGHPLLSPAYLIFVLSLGQLILVAAASLIFLIPAYAYTRWKEPVNVVHPLPAPAAWKIIFGSLCNFVVLAIIFLTCFTPIGTTAFTNANIAFQFFPVAMIPLLFVPRSKKVISKPGSALAREEPRLFAAQNYQLLSFIMIGCYWFGVYWGGKPLLNAIRDNIDLKTDGPFLLFWDLVGVLCATYCIVQIDSIVDESKVIQGAKRIHSRRLFLEDAILGLPVVLLFGPGWAISRYFQRREILAEKIRFGATEKDD